jgi:hypothetical protein
MVMLSKPMTSGRAQPFEKFEGGLLKKHIGEN